LNAPREAENPYQPPEGDVWVEPADDRRLLTARFEVGYRGNYRAIRVQFEQHRWFRHGSLALQLLVFLVLMAALVYRWPFLWVLLATSLLIVLNLLQLVLPHVWTWQRIREAERTGCWPASWGSYQLQVSQERISVARQGEEQHWQLGALLHVYYLGDCLLIELDPDRFVPIPKDADFGLDNFHTFCRQFALRYRAQEASDAGDS
jgi:hypothetical protein